MWQESVPFDMFLELELVVWLTSGQKLEFMFILVILFYISVLLWIVEKVSLKRLRGVLVFFFFKSIFIYPRKDWWFLIMLPLRFQTSRLSLGIFPVQQSRQLLAAESSGIWETLLLWIKLDSSFCNCIRCLTPLWFPWELHWDQI